MNWSTALQRLHHGFWSVWNTFVKFSYVLFVFLVVVGVVIGLSNPNKEQEAQAQKLGVPILDFLYDACEFKSRCDKQQEIKLSCAEAGNIDRCIGIKLQGQAVNEYCDLVPASISPTARQCLFPRIRNFLVGHGVNK